MRNSPPLGNDRLADRGAGMIQLDGVGLRYGAAEPVLRDLSFAVPAGGFRWLLGPSGAGKTSLLRLLTLASRPSANDLKLIADGTG